MMFSETMADLTRKHTTLQNTMGNNTIRCIYQTGGINQLEYKWKTECNHDIERIASQKLETTSLYDGVTEVNGQSIAQTRSMRRRRNEVKERQ